MKKSALFFLKFLLTLVCFRVLRSLKITFQSESDDLKKVLNDLCFHRSICSHPSVIFGSRVQARNKKVFLKQRLRFIKKCIKIGILRNQESEYWSTMVGLQYEFYYHPEFWFEDSLFPIVPYSLPTVSLRRGRIIIYSVLTGNYDNIHEILFREEGVEYLLFTNNPSITSKTWRVVFVSEDIGNVLLSRKIKILPHQYLPGEYDYSIYVDANAIIYGELSLLTSYLNEDISFAVSRHHERSSVKDEVSTLIERGMVSQKEATNQYLQYQSEGFKDDLGLAECSILVRKHKEKDLQMLMESWWEEFQRGVRRDQVSLMPCIHRLNFTKFAFMDGYVRHNQFCRIVDHKRPS